MREQTWTGANTTSQDLSNNWIMDLENCLMSEWNQGETPPAVIAVHFRMAMVGAFAVSFN